ncbi:MAG: hypothetical protein IKY23_10340 [Lachnospiraceae bacterium]|nr:hypothetical protein [Lachnospiraceae bacterium]
MRYNIDGKFPMMANWLMVKRPQNGVYEIKNTLTEEWLALSEDVFGFLKDLDGDTNPKLLGEKWDVDYQQLLDEFEEYLLIRKGRNIKSGLGKRFFTLFIPRRKRSSHYLLKLINASLMIGWLPILIAGSYSLLNSYAELCWGSILLSSLLSLVLGIVFHEFAHVMACLSYGGSLFEVGIAFQLFYSGAYVLIDSSRIRSRLKRIQVMAAGAEANLMLAGIFLFLASLEGKWNGCFLVIAINNILLAIYNMTFASGLDGNTVIQEILGFSDSKCGVLEIFLESIWGRNRKNYSVYNRGVMATTCLIIACYHILFPVVIINSILMLIGAY